MCCRAHDRDDKKRSQSPADQMSSNDVHFVTRDHDTLSSPIPLNHPSSSFIGADSHTASSSQLAADYQLSAAAVVYCVQPQYNVVSIPSYLLAPAFRASR